MKTTTIAFLVAATALAGCAKKSSDIKAAYISPLQYQNHSCGQIFTEAQHVSFRLAQAAGIQNQTANDDTGNMVGGILFWLPSFLFIKGNSEAAAEVARLKGHMEALEQANHQKRCNIPFRKVRVSGDPHVPDTSEEF
ncbi:hypothetical protein [Pseudohalocynthiibacter sp. F2068]|jgi:hypothetical protein|uniref:hypothetical protein n=1 Tax=Pseudohalocynthiibacter sp. F2068 TaxID=2926418 RepID=UPI001FF1CEE5|nr:hypothetical protein [Pseudohalocynthiibacter sp. F2068]MCK0100988.1 hypothetical protein [Pseudohalocynthiibacter sp. F2068]